MGEQAAVKWGRSGEESREGGCAQGAGGGGSEQPEKQGLSGLQRWFSTWRLGTSCEKPRVVSALGSSRWRQSDGREAGGGWMRASSGKASPEGQQRSATAFGLP